MMTLWALEHCHEIFFFIIYRLDDCFICENNPHYNHYQKIISNSGLSCRITGDPPSLQAKVLA